MVKLRWKKERRVGEGNSGSKHLSRKQNSTEILTIGEFSGM
jgi:hypothetical protein